MLPSAALMPPCAATVWLRVGNSLVMHLQRTKGLGRGYSVSQQLAPWWRSGPGKRQAAPRRPPLTLC